MNIFITSDTHGDLSQIISMYNVITSDKVLEGIPHVDRFDCLIHCGDYKRDALELREKLGLELYSVFGNCDRHREQDFEILDTPAGSILITHGHMEDVRNTHDHLYELAMDQGCNCICYGHTHMAAYGDENGYLVINPGSPTRPRDGSLGSCAILTADENGYSGQLIYFDDVVKAIVISKEKEERSEAESAPEQEQKPEPEKPADKPAKKKSSTGGFLRRIFNYSDGQ